MNAEHEKYIFYQECVTSLNVAWNIVDVLARTQNHKVVASAAYRMAFIEYAKPYKKSRGTFINNHTLTLPNISIEDKILHEHIIYLRDRVIAHSDLEVKNAKLHFGNIAGKSLPLIIYNTAVVYPSLTEFRGLIERSLDQLYKEVPNLES